jgi:hypothetical protein
VAKRSIPLDVFGDVAITIEGKPLVLSDTVTDGKLCSSASPT